MYYFFIFEILFLTLSIIIPLLIAVAFFTLSERKLMASIQRRVGPNVVGIYGLLQPLADGLKLIIKETIVPSRAEKILFLAAPGYTFFLSLIPWSVIPFSKTSVFADVRLSLLFIFTCTSLGVYGVLVAGWASNSRYAFLGAVRSAAQVIAYELPLGVIISTIGLFVGSYNLIDIIMAQENIWFLFPLFPLFLLFLIIILIETNRSPSDLPESESELVAGYTMDYSAVGFAMFFLGEYSNMLIMATMVVTLFLGGWYFPFTNIFLPELIFSIKVVVISFYFIWVRATVPRIRYDFLMNLGWKKLLPFSFGFFIFISSFLLSIEGLPSTAFFLLN